MYVISLSLCLDFAVQSSASAVSEVMHFICMHAQQYDAVSAASVSGIFPRGTFCRYPDTFSRPGGLLECACGDKIAR